MEKNRILIVLGMVRSGTSFTASWLKACGLNMGEKFLRANSINKKGFFEDRDMVEFQDKILQHNRINFILDELKLDSALEISTDDKKVATHFINQRNESHLQWGWKDPRTPLLMKSLWHNILPHAKIFVIYRPYEDVVDSIFRASKNMQLKRTNKIFGLIRLLEFRLNSARQLNNCLRAWIRHNQEILACLECKDPQDYYVTSVKNLAENSRNAFDILTRKMEFELNYVDAKTIYDKEMLKINLNEKYPFAPDLKLTADRIMKELNRLELKSQKQMHDVV